MTAQKHERFIKPRAGLVVRHPGNARVLATDGEHVAWSSHWQRRLQDGDVIEFRPPAPARAAAKAKTQESD